MRHPLADVYSTQERQKLFSAYALLTVLDGGMHQFFFSITQDHCQSLQQDQAHTLTAEIEHCRIDYRRKHLYWLGAIMHLHRRNDGQLH